VHEAVTSPLDAWEAFYVIVGSSAAALTGLQFVVIALVAESRKKSTISEIDAFGTPTVVHFSAVLLISAILSAPWPTLDGAAVSLGICGLAGVVYSVLVVRRARRQTGYQPVFEDWLFHAILPFVAYGGLLGAAATVTSRPEGSLFWIGGVALLLLFIGIHNSWDTVTYIALDRLNTPGEEPAPGPR
jgi:hypothetical protein